MRPVRPAAAPKKTQNKTAHRKNNDLAYPTPPALVLRRVFSGVRFWVSAGRPFVRTPLRNQWSKKYRSPRRARRAKGFL